VFVGLNAAFDWMFVNEYFHRHLGRNPFGHSALDIQAYAMGRDGGAFDDTSLAQLVDRYGGTPTLSHHALVDARVQADLFARLLQR
jgi:DNA polymerase III epsilon subunit-like protein